MEFLGRFGLFKETPWTLHNPLKGWTLQGLSLEEARLVVATLTLAEQSLALVWHKNWEGWLRLKSEECRDLFVPFEARGENPPEIPANLLQDTEEDITQVRPVLQSKKKIIDRRHDRYLVIIDCDIIVADHTFSTKTKDISVGGFCFEDPFPDWVAGYFTVVIKTEPPLEVTCMMVEDQKKEKFRAEIMDNTSRENLEALADWLENSGFPILQK